MYNDCNLISHIIFIINYIIMIVMLIIIAINYFAYYNEFDFIWFCSKIFTIKNMVKEKSFTLQLFNNFTSDGEILGLETNYYLLLNLTTNKSCPKNYRNCGILDTLGNILCVDKFFPCPINKIIVDYISKKEEYLSSGYKIGYSEFLSYNFQLYYSNDYLKGNATIELLKFYEIYEIPKYIDYDNLYIDMDAFQNVFGKIIYSNESKGVLVDGADEVAEFAGGIAISLIGNMVDLIADYAKARKLEKFVDYITEKIEEDENNIDKYSIPV